jgi:hypothetical protein
VTHHVVVLLLLVLLGGLLGGGGSSWSIGRSGWGGSDGKGLWVGEVLLDLCNKLAMATGLVYACHRIGGVSGSN